MKRKTIPLLLAAALLTAAPLAGCTTQGAMVQEEETITPVSVTEVGYSAIASQIVYAGQITPIESVNVSSKIAGKVKNVFYDVGDTVYKDDVLFTLDEVDLRNQMRQLESQLKVAEEGVRTAQNALATVTGGQYSTQVLQLETGVENAERQVESAKLGLKNAEIAVTNAQDALANTETTYYNIKTLYDAGSASKNDFDGAELRYKQAQAGLEQALVGNNSAKLALEQAELGLKQAQENLVLVTGDVTNENRQKARLGISQAEAQRDSSITQLEILRESLNDIAVKAPISGVVSARTAKASEYTSTQVAAFSLVDMDTVTVNVKVSELLINLLQPGQTVEVHINTVSKEPFAGKITTISPAADQTSMYPVKIEIANPDGMIKPGMFAEARFVRAENATAIVLPRNAVLADESTSYVFTDGGGVARKVPVTTGIDNGKEIEITSGLAVGDRVIVKGQSYIGDGDKIQVVE